VIQWAKGWVAARSSCAPRSRSKAIQVAWSAWAATRAAARGVGGQGDGWLDQQHACLFKRLAQGGGEERDGVGWVEVGFLEGGGAAFGGAARRQGQGVGGGVHGVEPATGVHERAGHEAAAGVALEQKHLKRHVICAVL
jgi:hypothetical protein